MLSAWFYFPFPRDALHVFFYKFRSDSISSQCALITQLVVLVKFLAFEVLRKCSLNTISIMYSINVVSWVILLLAGWLDDLDLHSLIWYLIFYFCFFSMLIGLLHNIMAGWRIIIVLLNFIGITIWWIMMFKWYWFDFERKWS